MSEPKLTVDDMLMLIMLDQTPIGQRVFNLISECRTMIDELDENDYDHIRDLLNRVDEILSPVGDARDGLLGLFAKQCKHKQTILDKSKWVGADSETLEPHKILLWIKTLLDGTEWNSGMLEQIAERLERGGYRIRDLHDNRCPHCNSANTGRDLTSPADEDRECRDCGYQYGEEPEPYEQEIVNRYIEGKPHDFNGGPVCINCGAKYDRTQTPTWCCA